MYGTKDSYLEKELGNERDDERLHHARVKPRAVNEGEKIKAQGTDFH